MPTIDLVITGRDAASGAVNSVVGSVERILGIAGGILLYTATRQLEQFGLKVVGMANDFETSMAKIAGLTDTPASAMGQMRDGVVAMSKEMQIPLKDLSEALYFIASSGYPGAQALDILHASAVAAAGGLGSTKNVADAITSALNAYGESADKATQYVDTLTAAVIEGKGEPEAYATSIGRILPIASALGVNFTEVAATMAQMTRTGLSADEAATALRGTLSNLLAPGAQAKDALAALGYTVEGLHQEMQTKGLHVVLPELIAKAKELDGQMFATNDQLKANANANAQAAVQAQAYQNQMTALSGTITTQKEQLKQLTDRYNLQVANNYLPPDVLRDKQIAIERLTNSINANEANLTVLGQRLSLTQGKMGGVAGETKSYFEILDAVIPNVRALTGTLSVGDKQAQTYQNTFEAIGASSGRSANAFAISSNTVNFQLGRVNNAIEAVAVGIQQKFSPQLVGMLAGLADRIPKAADEATAALSDLLGKIGSFGVGVGFAKFLGLDGDALAIVEKAQALVMKLAGQISDGLGQAMSFVSSQSGTFTAALKFINDNFDTIVGVIGQVVQGFIIFSGSVSALTAIGAVIAGVIAVISSPILLLAGAITLVAMAWINNWGGIRDIVMNVVTVVSGAIQTFLAAMTQWWTDHGAQVMAVVGAVMGFLQTIFSAGMAVIQEVVGFALFAISSFWSQHGASVMTIVNGLSAAVQAIFQFLFTAVTTYLQQNLILPMQAGLAALQAFWEQNGAAITATVFLTWMQIQTSIMNAVNFIGAIVDAFAALFTTNWSTVWATIVATVSTAWNDASAALWAGINSVYEPLKTFVTEAMKIVGGANWGTIGKNVVDGIKKGIMDALAALLDAIKSMVKDMLKAAQDAIGAHSPSLEFAKIGEMASAGMAMGIQNGSSAPIAASQQMAYAMVGAGNTGAQTALPAQQGGGLTINNTFNVSNGLDVQEAALQIIRMIQRNG